MTKRGRWLSVMLVSAVVLLVIGVTWSAHLRKQRTMMNSGFLLSPEKLVTLSKRAEEGDGDAAMAIFLHYNVGLNDGPMSYAYLKKAFESGNPRAAGFMENPALKAGVESVKAPQSGPLNNDDAGRTRVPSGDYTK